MSRTRPAIDAERVSYVAHELRSPLAVVSGYTSFLLDDGAGALAPEQREVLDRVRRSLTALERLLADVAEFAGAVVARDGETSQEEADLREPLAEAADLYALLGAGAEDSLDELRTGGPLPGGPLPVLGDPLALRQCVLAVTAWMARGSTRGRVAAAIARGPDEVRVEWRSSGMQVPADLAATLHDPFAAVPGLGDAAAWRLGLAAAASHLCRMGGGLEISREGDDLVVTLRFRAPGARPAAG